MATYIIGDLHGCFDEFQAILKQANFDPAQDELWLTGDLVARGERSLDCFRFVKQLGDRATVVLGNHDLHLLATLQGIKPIKARDRVEAIFEAEDRLELQTWLRNRPLVAQHPTHYFLMAHAGISPQWILPPPSLAQKMYKRDYKATILYHCSRKCTATSRLAGRLIYKVSIDYVTVSTFLRECAFAMPTADWILTVNCPLKTRRKASNLGLNCLTRFIKHSLFYSVTGQV